MAKGLGQILAEGYMALEKSRIDKGEAVPCPLCGHAMEYNSSWFCYNKECKPFKQAIYKAWIEADPDTRPVSGGYDDFQGITLAAILDDLGRIAVEFCTVRGGGGRTNYKVSWWGTYKYDNNLDDADLPSFIKGREWIWQDFIPDKIAERIR